jgi:hypothetical protein
MFAKEKRKREVAASLLTQLRQLRRFDGNLFTVAALPPH